jgi:hypothetical protein
VFRLAGGVALPIPPGLAGKPGAKLVFRPQYAEVTRAAASSASGLTGTIVHREFLGATVRYSVGLGTGEVTSTTGFRVNLSETGRMEGQVMSLMREDLVQQSIEGNNLLLYKDGELIARSISDPLGRFAFEDVEPGAYGIICAGPGGYVAFAFEAVMPALSATIPNRETLVNTMVQQPPVGGPFSSGDVLPVVSIPPPAVPGLVAFLRDPNESEEQPLPFEAEAAFSPVAGGGGAGFGGGGAGGGGAMGGAGGLLGLAGLGIAAAAAGSGSGDRVIVNPTPDDATPANVLP